MKKNPEDFVRQFILKLWNNKSLPSLDACISPSANIQTIFSSGIGSLAFHLKIEKIRVSFSDMEFSIHDKLKQEDKFIYTWGGKALHTGNLLNIQATGEEIVFSGMTIVETTDNLITRYQSFSDLLRVLNPEDDYITLSPVDIDYIISAIRDLTGRRLTKREVECLSLWLRGFSIKETAKILGGLSGRTIQTFRENIKRKLNVENYQQLFSLIQKSVGILILLKNQPTPSSVDPQSH